MQNNGEALIKGLLLRSCTFLLIVGEMCRVSVAQDRFSLRLNVSSSPAAPTLLIYFSLIYFLALFLYIGPLLLYQFYCAILFFQCLVLLCFSGVRCVAEGGFNDFNKVP